jgi:hypothetical protein
MLACSPNEQFLALPHQNPADECKGQPNHNRRGPVCGGKMALLFNVSEMWINHVGPM